MKPKRTFAGLLAAMACLAALPATAAAPQRPFYGRWLVAEAHPAPWYNPSNPGTAPVDDHLVGKSIVYMPSRIIGPRVLACKRPHYRMATPDYLFQGGLTAPAAQAAALGSRCLFQPRERKAGSRVKPGMTKRMWRTIIPPA